MTPLWELPKTNAIPKYDIEVSLIGFDGNIFSIMGRIVGVMQSNKIDNKEINKFTNAVMDCESYNDALIVCAQWVKTA